MSQPHTQAMQQYLASLKDKSWSELQGLAESQEVLLDDEGKQRALLWRDLEPDGSLKLVLQALSGGSMCCLGELVATGYAVTAAGKWQELDADALAEFQMC